MADDRTPPLDDDDDDWGSGWDDDDDFDAPAAAPETSSDPAAVPHSPAGTGPAAPPTYDDSPADDDDDVLLPPSPSDVIHERNQQQRQPARAPRVRPAGVGVADPGEPAAPARDVDTDEPRPAGPRNGRGCVLSLILAVTLFAVAVAMILLAFGGSFGSLFGASGDDPDEPQPAGLPLPSSAAPVSSEPADTRDAVSKLVAEECVDSGDEDVTVGNGAGDQKTGEGVILAFDHAYYVERSGKAARGFMSDSIKETTADSLQGAIDKLPTGTEHCLTITPDSPNVYKVELAEYVPDGDEVTKSVYDQEITVDKVDDRYVIVGVVNG